MDPTIELNEGSGVTELLDDFPSSQDMFNAGRNAARVGSGMLASKRGRAIEELRAENESRQRRILENVIQEARRPVFQDRAVRQDMEGAAPEQMPLNLAAQQMPPALPPMAAPMPQVRSQPEIPASPEEAAYRRNVEREQALDLAAQDAVLARDADRAGRRAYDIAASESDWRNRDFADRMGLVGAALSADPSAHEAFFGQGMIEGESVPDIAMMARNRPLETAASLRRLVEAKGPNSQVSSEAQSLAQYLEDTFSPNISSAESRQRQADIGFNLNNPYPTGAPARSPMAEPSAPVTFPDTRSAAPIGMAMRGGAKPPVDPTSQAALLASIDRLNMDPEFAGVLRQSVLGGGVRPPISSELPTSDFGNEYLRGEAARSPQRFVLNDQTPGYAVPGSLGPTRVEFTPDPNDPNAFGSISAQGQADNSPEGIAARQRLEDEIRWETAVRRGDEKAAAEFRKPLDAVDAAQARSEELAQEQQRTEQDREFDREKMEFGRETQERVARIQKGGGTSAELPIGDVLRTGEFLGSKANSIAKEIASLRLQNMQNPSEDLGKRLRGFEDEFTRILKESRGIEDVAIDRIRGEASANDRERLADFIARKEAGETLTEDEEDEAARLWDELNG